MLRENNERTNCLPKNILQINTDIPVSDQKDMDTFCESLNSGDDGTNCVNECFYMLRYEPACHTFTNINKLSYECMHIFTVAMSTELLV